MAMSLLFCRNRPSKYSSIISRSVQNGQGPPVVYQLETNKQMHGTLRKITFGEKVLNQTNRSILLVGETGTGKTTLINALLNHAMGVQWEDDVWFQIVEEKEEDNKSRHSESQTSDVSVYQIFDFEGQTLPFSLTIIDTPGYGDTRGTENDDIVRQRLYDLFSSVDGVHEVDTVGLVLKASENRLTDRLRYVFDSVMSLFGKDLEKKIVALLTHSDSVTARNTLQALEDANIHLVKDEEGEPVYFLFNNCQTTPKNMKNKVGLKCAWDLTKDQIHQLTDFLEKASPQNMKESVEVLKSHIQLTACIQNLKERIDYIELKQKGIQQTQDEMKNHEQEMKNNENFTIEVDEIYKDKQDIKGGWWFPVYWLGKWIQLFYEGALCCTVCEENCHYPGCTMSQNPRSCEVMKKGHCTSCSKKSPASDHVKEEWIYVVKTRKVQRTKEEIKKKYEINKAGTMSKLSLLEGLKRDIEDLQKAKDLLLQEAYQHVVKLEQIALNQRSLSTLVHLDFLIEKMREKGDEVEKVKKLEDMKMDEEDKGMMGALHYGYKKVKSSVGRAVKQLKENKVFH